VCLQKSEHHKNLSGFILTDDAWNKFLQFENSQIAIILQIAIMQMLKQHAAQHKILLKH